MGETATSTVDLGPAVLVDMVPVLRTLDRQHDEIGIGISTRAILVIPDPGPDPAGISVQWTNGSTSNVNVGHSLCAISA